MKMKLLPLCALLLMSFYLKSQNDVYIDLRLKQAFPEEYLSNLTRDFPLEIQYLNWSLDNSYDIVELGIEKCESLPYLKSFNSLTKTIGENIQDIDVTNFNYFNCYFERQQDRKITYRIGNTGKAIVFYSFSELVENFNKHNHGK